MAGKITTCARFRESMADAADAALSPSLRTEFDVHLRDCATCREELRRVQMLLEAINDGVSASVAAEPSPQLIANVPQRIAEQQYRAPAWWRQRAWLTAASACATLAILLFAARTTHKLNQPLRGPVPNPIASSSAPSNPSGSPTRRPAVESATSVPPRKPAPLFARHASPPALDRPAPEPEIIVEPGQMRAVLEFVAALKSGQVDGTELLGSQREANQPLEIKPLVIAPLKISALKDESGPSTSNDGQDSHKSFVRGRSN
jgi:Putative zinc-finger